MGCAATQPADYALKFLKPHSAERPECIAMLRRECEIAQTVTQAHLLPALASHLKSAPYFMVTPYVSGASVAQLLASHVRLDVPDATWIARQTAEALAQLHRTGWIHGDVKPANVLVSPHGHVTLLDCGLARRLATHECDANDRVAGTLEYTAPELLQTGETIGASSDIYALGVSLFQMLTGQLPFHAADAHSWVEAHLQTAPLALRSIVSYLPTELATLLQSMLAKHPQHRPTAAALVSALCAIEIDTFSERQMLQNAA